ncbi:MAG: hypothetical protein KAS21_04720 [Candidatus Aminicenantes bacterium]|nr:hypothetical protein [Candidatus Aminicenantes bacterium]
MKPYARFSLLFFLIPVLLFVFFQNSEIDQGKSVKNIIKSESLRAKWKKFSGGREGKILYANPPNMMILYLHKGIVKKLNGIVVEGGKGRWKRGKTPRPFWSPDGSFFVYRYSGDIFIADEYGKKILISNKKMDTAKETRWSIITLEGEYYIFGPSKTGTGIAVSIDNPGISIEIFPFPVIDKHCELTGDGKYIVYNNGRDIFVSDLSSRTKGIKISSGQNCRPCASPQNYAAWLPAPHIRYNIHNVKDGTFVKEFKAPENEEIYRLNWSNDEEFAVHMYGSRGNTRIHIRNFNNGNSLFVGNGWDPDLWIEKNQ